MLKAFPKPLVMIFWDYVSIAFVLTGALQCTETEWLRVWTREQLA